MGEFGTLNFSVGFKKTSAFPLDADGYFTSLEDAQQAASTAVEPGSADSVYYIGQTLTVVEGENSTQYIIQPDKTLKNVSSEDVYISNTPPQGGDYKLFVDTDEEAETVEIYTKTETDSKLNLKQDVIKTVDVSVDNNVGVPSGIVTVNKSNISFAFKNLKGEPGEKGVAFTYDDFTPEQIQELQKPATDAAAAANQAAESATQAAQSANQATESANTAAENATAKGNEAVQIATDKGNEATQIATTKGEEAVQLAQTSGEEAKQTANEASQQAIENSKMQWFPSVDSEGNLTWSRSSSETAPASVNIKGPQGNSGATGSTDNIVVINDLNGGESTAEQLKVLAAEQGKVLNEKIFNISNYRILEWNTDSITTHKQVLSQDRKEGMQISYKHPEKGWINEQFIGSGIDDISWSSELNWVDYNVYNQLVSVPQNKGKSANYFCDETGKLIQATGQTAYGYSVIPLRGKNIRILSSRTANAVKYAFYKDAGPESYNDGEGFFSTSLISVDNACVGGIGVQTTEIYFEVTVPEDAGFLMVSDPISVTTGSSYTRDEYNKVIDKNINEVSSQIGLSKKIIREKDMAWEDGGIMRDGYPGSLANKKRTNLIGVGGYKEIIFTADLLNVNSGSDGTYYAFYDSNGFVIRETIAAETISDKNLAITITKKLAVPSNAYYFAAGFRTTTYQGFYLECFSDEDSVKPKLDDASEKSDSIYSKLFKIKPIEDFTDIKNYEITEDGTFISKPTSVCRKFDVSTLNGKTLKLKQVCNTIQSNTLNYCFYNIQYGGFNTPNTVTTDDVVETSKNFTRYNDIEIIVPTGAKTLVCFVGTEGFDYNGFLEEAVCETSVITDIIGNIPVLDTTGYPQPIPSQTYWKLGNVNYGPHIPFNPTYINNGLNYGGANLVTGKKLIYFGDSMVENCDPIGILSQLTGIYIHGYSAGGRNSLPVANSWDSRVNKFTNMQFRIAEAIADSPAEVDYIVYENANDMSLKYHGDYDRGTIDDAPFYCYQFIEYENNYTSKEQVIEGFETNFEAILAGKTVKRGSIVSIKYSTTAYNLQLSGTPTNGTFKIVIGSKEYIIETTSTQTLQDIATNIATFDFEGFSVSANGSTVTLTLQGGYSDVAPTISNNTSGININVQKSSSSAFIFFYFMGYTEEDFRNKEKWTQTVPSLYAVYKGNFEALSTAFPKAKIYIWQPLRMGYTEADKAKFSYPDGSLNISAFQQLRDLPAWKECRQIQSEVAELYGYEVVDSQRESCCNIFNESAFFGGDKVHHNEFASRVAAMSLYRHINA